jgi:hypothetical protein
MSDNIKGKAFWGPPIWTTVHILAATYKPETREAFVSFLWSLTKLLPCDECKSNLIKKLQSIPIEQYLSNNHDAFFLTYILHDSTNEHISDQHPNYPPKESPRYDDIKAFYFNALSQECKECGI